MSDPGLHFTKKSELLKWFEENLPESYKEYLEVKEKVRTSGFPGAVKLIKREKTEELVGFNTFLTELNIADLLLEKNVKNLCYEPKSLKGIDFSFDNICLSVKSLTTKDYEKKEHDEIEKMIAAGGGQNIFAHKKSGFSSTLIEVEKNEMGTYTRSRTETGHKGFLDSDLYQMSPPLEYMGEFESLANTDQKKVLFIANYSEDFSHYHIIDIAWWYFDSFPKGYVPILTNDRSWYLKLFRKDKKENNIDALVFMYPTNPMIWPENCFGEIINKKARLMIFSKDVVLIEDLKKIFNLT